MYYRTMTDYQLSASFNSCTLYTKIGLDKCDNIELYITTRDLFTMPRFEKAHL